MRQELAGLVGEIEQDRAGLEYSDRRATADGFVIDDRGNAVVRRYFQELAFELFPFSYVDRKYFT